MNVIGNRTAGRRRTVAAPAARAVEVMEPRRLMSTYTVNTTSDAANPGAGLLTLRQAVADANAHPGADTVVLDSKFLSNNYGQQVITLTRGPIAFTDTTGTTTVNGLSPKVLTVSGDDAGRVFTTAPKTTTVIEGMVITGGRQTAADAAGNTYGGAIYSQGSLALDTVTLEGNAVVASGLTPGAQPYDQFPGAAYGGGVYATGPLTVSGSMLIDNSVTNTAGDANTDGEEGSLGGSAAGGAVYATGAVTLIGGAVSQNTATGVDGGATDGVDEGADGGAAAGGGVFAGGAVTATGVYVIGNTAQAGSGEVTGNGAGAFGGGLFAGGAVTMTGSFVRGNSALGGDSGDADGDSGAVQGGGIYAGGALAVSGTEVSGNVARGGDFDAATMLSAGGGVYAAGNAVLATDTVENNSLVAGPDGGSGGLQGAGGGAYVVGTLSLSNAAVSGNSVTADLSEAASAGRDGGSVAGGGVAVLGRATITGSTLDHDSATGGAGYGDTEGGFYYRTNGGEGFGGGLYARSAVTMTNSTVVDDTATGGDGGSQGQGSADSHVGNGGDAAGGGLYVAAGLTLADSTVSGNAATAGAAGQAYQYGDETPAQERPNGTPGTATAGGLDAAGGTVTLTNSVVSGDTVGGAANDVAGTLSGSSRYDLVGVGGGLKNGTNGNKVGVTNPLLSALGDNGGATETEVPLPGSPLIDAGSNALVPKGVTTDQRGAARVAGKAVDIGAVEYTASTAKGSISGTVFVDGNADGVEDAAEAGGGGFTVYADVNHDGKLDAGDVSATTAANGTYTLPGLPAGQYTVSVVARSGYRATTATAATVGVSGGEAVAGPTFGQTQAAVISGTVFDDLNGNGKRDAGEPTLSGFRVYLDANGNGQFDDGEPAVKTDSAGNWSFGLLAPGTYTVRIQADRVTTPAGGSFTFGVGNGSARVGNAFGVEITDD